MDETPPVLRLYGVPALGLPAGEHIFVPDRPHQLLALLACRRDWVPRAEIAEWLWSDRGGSAALSNLRKVLLRAQQVLAACGAAGIELRPGLLRWSPDSDLRRFERACDEARAADALKLANGVLLQGLDAGLSKAAEEWLAFERARLAARWRAQAATHLAALRAQPERAAEMAGQLLASDPGDDAALEALVHARLQQGQPALALRELESLASRLGQEYGVEPPARLRALLVQCRQAADGAPAPPPAPAQASPRADIVGRRLELMQLRDWLLHEGRRVVSITGLGGVGKTRLARAFMQQLAGTEAPVPVWVPLADLRDTGPLPLRLGTVLGLPATGSAGADPWAPVVARLQSARLLLVLDNGEQVAGLADALAPLLAACPGLQLLNVSRVRLPLEGEWLLPLDGLPLPDPDETDAALLRRNDAVALFEQRARAGTPGFDLAAQAAAVVRLLHAVDGLPLAIELGATLTRLLPLAEIEAALTAPGVPALDAGFELSWQLLGASEQKALHALARLPADVDRLWAEQVARAPLPVLMSLADKSLLRADGSGRFGLHPLLRRWAAARLNEPALHAAIDERHTAAVVYLLEQLSRQGTATPGALVTALRDAWSHVVAAWKRAVAGRQVDVIARMTPVLQRFFELHGGWTEGVALLAAALPTLDTPAGDRARRQVQRALATLELRCARYEACEAHAREALRGALRAGDGALAAASLTTLGLSLFSRGQYAQAQTIFAQTLRRSRTLGDPVRLDVAMGNLAIAEMALGRFEQALTLFEPLIARSRASGETGGLIVYLGNAGEALRGLGRWDAALAAQREALELCDRHGVRSRRVTKLLNMGSLHHARGDSQAASALLAEALGEARSAADRSNEAGALLARALLAVETRDPAALRADLGGALAIAQETASDDHAVRCALVLGEWLLCAGGDAAAGLGWLGWALAQPALYAVERAAAVHRLARRGLQPPAPSASFDAPATPRDAVQRVSLLLEHRNAWRVPKG